jgi:hypothetical protein
MAQSESLTLFRFRIRLKNKYNLTRSDFKRALSRYNCIYTALHKLSFITIILDGTSFSRPMVSYDTAVDEIQLSHDTIQVK